MFSRSNSMVLSLPTNNFYQASFDFKTMPRSTEPEIFTFERVPAHVPQRSAPVRPKRRNARVLYPQKVRKYLPPAEKSPAKRWLLILCLVVFMQIYTEDSLETQVAATDATDAFCDGQCLQYNVLTFQSAEEQARQMTGSLEELTLKSQEPTTDEENTVIEQLLNTTCPSLEDELTTMYEQSTRNGYVVALLYPVYHRLGSEK
ncbi:radiation-inducible immediate-early gene IEX-1 [Chanos chanos]|uniref:Radiation-inducible immediate-early gene IEX-1 n=1 Tax=Chanos chanos TaxID=29144 RepID=A0A6J2WT95_CHACN|nr:radiation-inducible immediate-early gene IEX-1 [Chanos chanos]